MQNQKMFLSNANRDKIFTMRDGTCSICLDEFANRSVIDTCNHEFCLSCIGRWSEVNATCPVCREDFHAIVHGIVVDVDSNRGGGAFTLRCLGPNGAEKTVDLGRLEVDMADLTARNESTMDKIDMFRRKIEEIVKGWEKSKAVVKSHEAELRHPSESCASTTDPKSFGNFVELVENILWRLDQGQFLLNSKQKVLDFARSTLLRHVEESDSLYERASDLKASFWAWMKEEELDHLKLLVDAVNGHRDFYESSSTYYRRLFVDSEKDYSEIYAMLRLEK